MDIDEKIRAEQDNAFPAVSVFYGVYTEDWLWTHKDTDVEHKRDWICLNGRSGSGAARGCRITRNKRNIVRFSTTITQDEMAEMLAQLSMTFLGFNRETRIGVLISASGTTQSVLPRLLMAHGQLVADRYDRSCFVVDIIRATEKENDWLHLMNVMVFQLNEEMDRVERRGVRTVDKHIFFDGSTMPKSVIDVNTLGQRFLAPIDVR